MNEQRLQVLKTIMLFGILGLLVAIGMFLSAWWGAYVSCHDGGGQLNFINDNVRGVQYFCAGFYIKDDPRICPSNNMPINPNALNTSNITWQMVKPS